MAKDYIGNSCWDGTVDEFLKTSFKDWLVTMVLQYHTVSPYELTESERESWRGTWIALHDCLHHMVEFRNLRLTFEYVIPGWDHTNCKNDTRRIDVLIRSDRIVAVFEFKERKTFEEHYADMIAKGVNSRMKLIKRFDENGKGLIKRGAVVILAQGGSLAYKSYRKALVACTGQKIGDVIAEFFGGTEKV